ncbi:MAG: sigma 54-interacting transcriptional regulator [Saprospiraceae bacterium]|nr:sigma 54-interacting transcriptional regulator [Saprospiraceae bacterium]
MKENQLSNSMIELLDIINKDFILKYENNIPIPDNFIVPNETIRQLDNYITENKNNGGIILLFGPSGSGKTSVANYYYKNKGLPNWQYYWVNCSLINDYPELNPFQIV